MGDHAARREMSAKREDRGNDSSCNLNMGHATLNAMKAAVHSSADEPSTAAPLGSTPDETVAAVIPRLAVTRYRLRFRIEDASALKGRYLGSTWRGAFGQALRRTVCIVGLPPTCDGCALLTSCVYPRTFEKRTPADAQKLRRYPHPPNPYVLAPASEDWDAADETLNLGLTLFGKANEDAPAILQALDGAGQQGLTRSRTALELVETQAETVAGNWTTLQSERGSLRSAVAQIVEAPHSTAPAAVRLRLLSPLRIRREGRYVRPQALDFRALASNLLRRISLLTYFFGETPWEPDFAALLQEASNVRIEDPALRWQEGVRHSSRQKTRIPMGGIVGSLVASGPAVATLWPCLWLGQWTHIGKGCTMGLGRYVLEPVNSVEGHWHGPNRL